MHPGQFLRHFLRQTKPEIFGIALSCLNVTTAKPTNRFSFFVNFFFIFFISFHRKSRDIETNTRKALKIGSKRAFFSGTLFGTSSLENVMAREFQRGFIENKIIETSRDKIK